MGSGELLTSLKKQAQDAGIADKVAFLGSKAQPDIVALLREADLFVLPSKEAKSGDRDGLPNVILEAMASGLPVVASGISGIPLAVEDGRTGLLVPEKEPEALLGALRSLLSDRATARRMGERGRSRAASELTWDAVAARYREGYLAALATLSMPV